MDSLRQIQLQEAVEERFNRKHIDAKIRRAVEGNAEMQQKIAQGVSLVEEFLKGPYYESKNRRLAQLAGMDLTELVTDLFVGVAYSVYPELFTSVSAKMAARLKFNDTTAAITTSAELLAVLCHTDAFDIYKEDRMASLMLVSRIPLGDQIVAFIGESQFLPPMVCSPLKLTHNFSSGYLTHNDSLLLGQGNHHDGDLCLDVLNTMNQVALSLDMDFLCNVDEEPTHDLDNQEKVDQWTAFVKQSQQMYLLMHQCGNRFYFNHKVDKRGRIYSQGYHINTQGNSYKKAMLELADPELIEGVPT